MKRIVPFVLVAVFAAGSARADGIARDEKRGFSFGVPDGFSDPPVGEKPPKALFTYVRGTRGTSHYTVLGVSGLGGTIGREHFDGTAITTELAAAMGMALVHSSTHQLAWHGMQLDGFSATMTGTAGTFAFAAVQVPLRAEAIQVSLLGTESQTELDAELDALIATVVGDSSPKIRIEGIAGVLLSLGILLWLRHARRMKAQLG